MKKILLIIIIILVALCIVILVLANLKSPENNKNLLSYWWFHSKSWQCKIEKQEYEERAQEVYNEDCLKTECEKGYGYLGRINWCNYMTSDSIAKSTSESDKIKYKSCLTGTKTISVPILAETNGQLEKYYYLGISILKESCPSGYSVK